MEEEKKEILAFKGFNHDMTCRRFKYKNKEIYETEKAELCSSGFHACERLNDCFWYYEPSKSVYQRVVLSGDIDNGEGREHSDSKIAATKITLCYPIKIEKGLVDEAVNYVINECPKFSPKYELENGCYGIGPGRMFEGSSDSVVRGGNRSYIDVRDNSVSVVGEEGYALSGDDSISFAGDKGAAVVGACGIAVAGDCGVASGTFMSVAVTGGRGISRSGYQGVSVAREASVSLSWDEGISISGIGSFSKSEDDGISISKGASCCGKRGIAIATQPFSSEIARVKGGKGSILIIKRHFGGIIKVFTACVDNEEIEENVWYEVDENGKFVKSENQKN